MSLRDDDLIIKESEARKSCVAGDGSSCTQFGLDNLRDLVLARTKGRGGSQSKRAGLVVPRRGKCSICKVLGHNRVTFPQSQRDEHTQQARGANTVQNEDNDIYFPSQYFDSD
ncbi:FAR1-related protein [Sesbania bispinosa]|nr:FAR1-related protein [Sesbania bispinosa]